MINNEIFCKPIEGYSNYFVDMEGNIWSTKQRHIKKLSACGDRYLKVRLSENNIKKSFNVHRLVAIAFVPNPKNLPVVMHMDDDIKNNYAYNLRWGTQLINCSSTMKNRTRQRKKCAKNVRKMCKLNICHCGKLKRY